MSKKKILVIGLLITALLVTAITTTLYLYSDKNVKKENINSEKKSYKTIEEAIGSQVDQSLANDIRNENAASKLYRDGDYKGASDYLEKILKDKVHPEVEPSIYSLLYNAYLRQDLLQQSKETIIRFMSTKSYEALSPSVKNQWEYQLDQINKGVKPVPDKGEPADEQ